jgi:hypothetical protein
MTLFAGVRGSMDYGDVTILVGPSRILFPTSVLAESVQWHYVGAEKNQSLIDILDQHEIGSLVKDIEALTMRRTFLGYYSHALVYVGTRDGINSSPIANSLAPKSSSRLQLAREGTLNAGFSTHGATGNVGAKPIFPKSLQVSLAGNRQYDNILESASERPLLIYDLSARSAWLVSELSVVLHLARKYLSSRRVQLRERRDVNHIVWPQLPYAETSADGGKSAHAVIQQSGHIALYTNTRIGKPQEFWSEVDNILKDLASIRTEECIRKKCARWTVRTPRLQG